MATRLSSFEVRQRVRPPTRAKLLSGLEWFGEATSDARPLPDFLIIGAQKAGTSALYEYLSQHPAVRPALTKEVHYFDLHPDRRERWYRGHFPRRLRPDFLTGEATPYYLFHPSVPSRVASMLPKVRLIALLRDPVRRAISHYHHEVALGHEFRTLERAISEEPAMMEVEERRLAHGLSPSPNHQYHSYVSRGLYAQQLHRWLEYVKAERLLIVSSEELAHDGGRTYARILDFLGLQDDGRESFEQVHQRRYAEPDPAVVRALRDRFLAPNQALVDLLGDERAQEFPWLQDSGMALPARFRR